jgi:hypothetical protein
MQKMGLFQIFKREKLDGRMNNGANLTPEVQRRAVEESAQIRSIRSETKKLQELVKYTEAAQILKEITTAGNETSDIDKFFQMVQFALSSQNPLTTPQPLQNEIPKTEQQTELSTQETEEEPENNWQKLYYKINQMDDKKFNKFLNLMEKF